MNLKRIYRLGTGCGIEIRGDDLRVVAAKSRPAGVSILGMTRLESFRGRPPQQWGAEYAVFLKTHGLTHLSATVALPRDEVIVRQLLLPPVSRKELAAAVRYQLDALHPFGEDEVYHAFAPLREPGEAKGQLPVAVAIAEKARVNGYADLFDAAGIAVAAFTVTDAALAGAVRVRWDNPPFPFVFAIFENHSVEVYGEAEDRPLWTAQFDLGSVSPAKVLQLTAAELRLDPSHPAALVICGESGGESGEAGDAAGSEAPNRPYPAEKLIPEIPAGYELRAAAEILPAPLQVPAGFDSRREAGVYAVALESACPRLGWRANLLPVERRKSDSRWMYAPTAALALALLLLAAAFALRPVIQDRRYVAALDAESSRLEKIVSHVVQTEEQSGHVRRRLVQLRHLDQRAETDLRLLRELSEVIPDNVWLQSLDINDAGVQMAGEGPAAAPLLGILDGSQGLTSAAFTASLNKTDSGERFQIGAKRRPQDDAPQETQAAAAPPPAPAAQVPSAAPVQKESETLNTISAEGAPAAGKSK